MAVISETGPSGRAIDTAVHERPDWYGHRLNRPGVYRLTAALGATLPRGLRLSLAATIAPRLRTLFADEWSVVLRNIGRIAPTACIDARHALAGEVFRHFAMCFSDLVVTNRRCPLPELLGRVDGHPHFEAAARRGRGFIVLTAHLGNWELGGRLVAEAVARPTHVVVEAEVDPRLEAFLRGGPAPVHFVVRRHPTDVLRLWAALRRGEVVAMQGDRAIGTRGDIAIPFFGAPARFPRGPFALARSAGVPVLPAFCVLDPDRRYSVHLREPIVVGRDGETTALERWVAVLEDMVRAYPEQWFNFFDCWSPSPGA
ncbi:MAG: lysophospholipid acyltransferase family protein [Candidatus Rokuibacteriota bacterium]